MVFSTQKGDAGLMKKCFKLVWSIVLRMANDATSTVVRGSGMTGRLLKTPWR